MADSPERKKLSLKPATERAPRDSERPSLRTGSRAHRVTQVAVREAALTGKPQERRGGEAGRGEQQADRPRGPRAGSRPPRDDRAFPGRPGGDRASGPRTPREEGDRGSRFSGERRGEQRAGGESRHGERNDSFPRRERSDESSRFERADRPQRRDERQDNDPDARPTRLDIGPAPVGTGRYTRVVRQDVPDEGHTAGNDHGRRPARPERFERGDRPQRFERGDRPQRPEPFARGDRPQRPERFERDRPERFERGDRPHRPEGFNRPGRPAHADRPQRPDRFAQGDRAPRPEGFARGDRPQRPEGFARSDRPQRPEHAARGDRPQRPERFAQGDRPPRPEGFARGDRPQRPERFERGERPARPAPADRGGRPQRFEQGDRRARTDAPAGVVPSAPAARPASQPAKRASMADVFAIFAPCPQGIEAALADELTALGFADATATRAGCSFTADWTGVMRANLHSRLATRILVQVAQAPVETEDDILSLAQQTPWERWFGPDHTLRVDTSAVRSPMQSLQYCNLRAKDGICDRLREVEGARPDIDTVRPDARVHLFLNETTATLYLDSTGESLFKRGWRFDKGEAPLRENLAAGLLALSGWKGDTSLMDPFCGSGTIMIEAAFIAMRIPPGISRPFAFERLRNHDDKLWQALKDDARAQIKPQLDIALIGSDISPQAIEAARSNARRAGLTENAIEFEVRDVREIRPPEGAPGWIVTNPPYGERLEDESIALWSDVAQTLKAHFGGWQVHIITTDRDLPRHMRLNPQRRIPLYNGALDCRLFGFELVSGSFRQRI